MTADHVTGQKGYRELVVTGAAGFIGSRVVARLTASGENVIGIVRDLTKGKEELPPGMQLRVADYDDQAAVLTAMRGAAALLIIPGDDEATTLERQTSGLIEAARLTGVPRILLLSIVDVAEESPFYFASAYRAAEKTLRNAGLRWTVLRCSLYSDLVWTHWVLPARTTGSIVLPAEEATVCIVSRDDVASAAAAVLRSDEFDYRVISLTGSEILSFADIARSANDVLGTELVYQACAASEYLERLKANVAPPWPEAFSSLFASVRQGRFASLTRDIERLIGRAPEAWPEFLARQRRD